MTVKVSQSPYSIWRRERLRVIKVAHLGHMTSMSRNKLTTAEGDKSLEQNYFYLSGVAATPIY